jgi:hypothetical protein
MAAAPKRKPESQGRHHYRATGIEEPHCERSQSCLGLWSASDQRLSRGRLAVFFLNCTLTSTAITSPIQTTRRVPPIRSAVLMASPAITRSPRSLEGGYPIAGTRGGAAKAGFHASAPVYVALAELLAGAEYLRHWIPEGGGVIIDQHRGLVLPDGCPLVQYWTTGRLRFENE